MPAGTLLLDEWQKLPQVWDSVRRRVDSGAPPGSYLLTGSATPTDAAGIHSGAGRILSLRMRPMALPERGRATPTVSLARLLEGGRDPVGGDSGYGLTDYADAIVTSGFPGIMNAPPRLCRGLLDAYLQRIIDRDLPDHGFAVRRPETLRRWLAAYAAASSTTTSYSRMLDATTGGDGAQPAHTTTIRVSGTSSPACGYWIRCPAGFPRTTRSGVSSRPPNTNSPTPPWRPGCWVCRRPLCSTRRGHT